MQQFSKTKIMRGSISLAALSLALGFASSMAQAQQITQGGGSGGFLYTLSGGAGGIAAGGGGAGSGGAGGAAAQTPGGAAQSGGDGVTPGGLPSAPNDIAAGGGGGGRDTAGDPGGNGGAGNIVTATGSYAIASAFIGGAGGDYRDGDIGGGGGGGAGLVLTGADVQVATEGFVVRGGAGGSGYGATGDGGGGAAGLVLLNGGSVTVNAGAGGVATTVQGGAGAFKGTGGAGLFLYSGGALTVENGNTVQGGEGGVGGTSGLGGGGVLSNLGVIVNHGTIAGGAGGLAFNRADNGGKGVTAWGGTIENGAGGLIKGGDGGQSRGSMAAMYSGVGGAGVAFQDGQASTLVNAGTIQGGNGGVTGNQIQRGDGGDGVTGATTGNITIINSGTIAAGYNERFFRAHAIALFGSDNRLELHAGSVILDEVLVSGGGSNNVLALGGASDATFDASQIGLTYNYNNTTFNGFDIYEKLGASTWTLTGANAEHWSIREGTLTGDASSMAGDLTFISGAGSRGVIFDQASDGTYGGTISGDGSVTKTGAGVLTLAGVGGYDWSIEAGALKGDSETLVGDLTFTGSAGSGEVIFDQGSDASYDHVISGDGALIKMGSGKLILTADSSGFSGPTTVTAGTLAVNGALGFGPVTVQSGATLGGTGKVGGTTIESGGHLAPGNSVGSLWVAGDLVLSSGSNLDIELGAPGDSLTMGVSDRVVIDGDLTFDGTVNLSQSSASADGVAGLGYYRLIQYGGDVLSNTAVIGTTPALSTVDYAFEVGDGRVDLFIAPAVGDNTLQHWQSGDGVWSAASTQWVNKDGVAPATWAGHYAVFKNLGAYTGGVITVEGAQAFQGLQFVDEGYSLDGSGQLVTATSGSEIRVLADTAQIGAQITGMGGVVKTEAGTLILTGTNTYFGGTSIQAGTLQIGAGGTTGSIVGNVSNAGVLAFDRSDAISFGGVISGSGAVRVLGGDVTFTADNLYTGATTIAAGSRLKLGDNGTTGSIVGDVSNDGVLAFNRSDAISFGGVISGLGAVRVLRSDVTLTADNLYTGNTTIAAGAQLQLGAGGATGSIKGDLANAGALVFDRSDALTFAGAISGAGTIRQVGSGKTELAGNSSNFSGAITVEQGALAVNGLIGGTLDVWATGRLQGVGTVGATVVSGTIAPGNSIGTLNVAGGVTFKPGSVFEVEANAEGQSDKIVASGAAVLQGGTVKVLAGAGNYKPQTSYLILHADGGISAAGKFDSVTSNLAFLDPSLSYDGNNVYLRLRRNDIAFTDIGLTPNQVAVGAGAESLDGNNPIVDAVVNLSADQARAAFDQLAGSDYASTRGALIQDSRFVRDAVLARGGLAGVEGLSMWGSAFGGWGDTKSDGNAQGHDHDTQGLLTGFDQALGQHVRAGVAVGYSSSQLKTTQAKHEIETYHASGYVVAARGAMSFQLGGAYAWNDVHAARGVAFAGFGDTLSSDYSARTFQVFGEVAVKRQLSGVMLQPFAGVAHVALFDAQMSETGGAAALHGGDSDEHVTYGSLGLRAQTAFNAGDLGLRLTGAASWRHAFGDRAQTLDLAFSTGSSFRTAGVPIDKDALALDVGLDADLSKAVSLGISYSGSYGDRATDHGARAVLNWRF